MWIAKNSITGKTYGRKFESIYECQAFIDNSLKLLEYEMRKAFALEQEFINEYELSKKNKNNSMVAEIGLRLTFAIDSFYENDFDKELMQLEFQKCFANKKTQRTIDKKIDNYVHTNWLKNNIIRCYNIEQKRFADGFDF